MVTGVDNLPYYRETGYEPLQVALQNNRDVGSQVVELMSTNITDASQEVKTCQSSWNPLDWYCNLSNLFRVLLDRNSQME